jgi:acyl transferase domain-containing protein/NADPH:quinone reductase-like Zn-dependent oxidoreductase/thioesterase domain-containing protein/NADP-dependent 3-hydroxy acid dehydrogenase YdfG/acyl carrier protein
MRPNDMTPAAPLAIIGYGCRLPGGVVDGPSFWNLLCEGRDAVREIPPDRWNARSLFSATPGIVGHSATKWAGFLDEIDQFEPECFGISPREAAYIDPQQRLLLETTWEALEHAGVPVASLAGTRTGVFIGISTGDYGRIQALPTQLRGLSAFTAQGTSLSIAANRISYCLDLRGPSFIVDTACSSSLVALDRAAKSLRERESDLAIVGGVNVIISADTFVSFSQASMLSPEGRCKAFDASARGFVRAEGAGVVLVKRLDEALHAGDRILAVLLATGVNQDGRTSGMAMPNGAAQEALLRQVYLDGGIAPETVRYVEAHGTGTAIGDPTEAGALGRALGAASGRDAPLIIGSVKTNIGHLEAAAGMASLLKAVLMVEARQIPPNLHFRTPNPNIPFDALGLRVPVTLEPWPDERPALIGINSFGFGGTNAHAVVSEYRKDAATIDVIRITPDARATTLVGSPPPVEPEASLVGSPPLTGHARARSATIADARDTPLIITARSDEALRLLVEPWLQLFDNAERSGVAFADVASAAARRRTHNAHVVGFSASGFAEARELLEAFRSSESRTGLHCRERPRHAPPLVFAFSGQGPQWYGMGRELLDSEPVFRDAIERCDALFEPIAGWSLLKEMRSDESASRMHHTSVAQPALFALQVALAELWKSWGIVPFAVVGHSVGEVAAAHVAGALSLESAVALIARRGRCLEEHALPGRMLAVALPESEAPALIEETGGRISVSAVNSPEMLTLGGDADTIEELAKRLSQRGVWCRALQVNHAFHTQLVEPAREPFLLELNIENRALNHEMVSTVTGQRMQGATLNAEYWWQNIRQPVRFADAVRELRELGADTFLEIGPHPVLSASIRQCRAPGRAAAVVFPSLARGSGERRTLLSSLVGLFAAGAKVDWTGVLPSKHVSLDLPRHPWMRQRYWHECAESGRMRLDTDYHPLLGMRGAGSDRRWQAVIDPAELTWLKDHVVAGRMIFPAAAFVEMALAAATRTLGAATCIVDDLRIDRALVLQEGSTPTLQLSANPNSFSVRISSRATEADEVWVDHVEATFRPASDQRERGTLDFGNWQQTGQARVPGSAVYDAYRSIDMEFGPAFKGIVEVTRRDGSALGRVQLPNEAGADEAFVIHPALLDSCFQVLLEALPLERRRAESMYLPERIDRIVYYRRPGRRAWSEVQLRSASPVAIAGDIRIFSEAGELAFEIAGFRCRSVPRPNIRSRPPISACFYRTNWHHQPLPFCSDARPPLMWRGGVERLVRRAGAAADGIWHDRSARNVEEALSSGDRLALAFVARAVRALGVTASRRGTRHIDLEALVASEAIVARFRPQIERCLEALTHAGSARRLDERSWQLTLHACDDVDRLWREGLARHPDGYPWFRLIEICGSELATLWSGKVDALEMLFSRESTELLEHIYRDDEWARYANAFIGQVVSELVAETSRDRPLRILEIGAGTGGTTGAILPVLPAERTEYWFTDVSQHFLSRAEEKLKSFPFVQYRRVDLESSFDEQGIQDGSFDVVIAADVLHTVHDIRTAVQRCRAALVDGGLLIARELSRSRLGFDVVFGITEGWWNYRGDPLRAAGPLFSAPEWSRLLEAEGFERPALAPGCEHNEFASVFIARAKRPRSSETTAAALATADALPPEREWIVFAEDEQAQALASRLRSRGLRCAEVRAGETFERLGPDAYSVDYERAEDRQRLGALCARELAAPYSAIYMPSLDVADAPAALACARLAHVLQALAAASTNIPRRLLLVLDGSTRRQASALVGFSRVAANEFGGLGIRMIEIDRDDPLRMDRLFAEIVADSTEEEVAWRGGHRFVPRLEPAVDVGSRRIATGLRQQIGFEVVASRAGDLDSLELRQMQARRMGSDEVEVEVHFTALNFRDVLKALGRFPVDDARQLALGDECSGVVRRVGRNVTHVKPGDRVAVCHPGTFRSIVTVPERAVAPIPETLDLQAAVTMPVAFLTVDYALRQVGRLAAGESVLIHAAAGGVGLAAVQIAQRVGARVLATAGSPAKRELLKRLGVECVMDSRSLAFFDDVMDVTGGRGVDVVLNSLAGQAMARSLASLAPGGRFLELGKRDFYENTHVGLWPLRRNVSYHAIDLSVILADGAVGGDSLRTVFTAVAGGELRPLPLRVLPVSRAAEAFRLMAQGGHIGKIVLDMTQHRGRLRSDSPKVPVRSNATYLVTGAFSGTGLTVMRWLADCGAGHFVLLSRHGPQSEAAHKTVEALRQSGRDVRVMTCDVADAEALASVLHAIDQSMPPLAGVFHLANVIDDALIVNLDAQRLAHGMAPKLDGAWNLHSLTRNRKLDHFVLFSSVSAGVGNFGQASYAAANAAVEQLARDRRACGLPATAIAWGMLGEAGFVAERPELGEALTQLGLSDMSQADVRDALNLAVTSEEPVLLAARMEWQRLLNRFPGLNGRSNLLSKLLAQTGDMPTGEGASRAAEAIKTAAPAERVALVAEYVRSAAARVLGMSPAKISTDRPLAELGLDSLMGVELATQIEAELGVPFHMHALGREITITNVAEALARHFGGPAVTTAEPAPAAPPARLDKCVVQLGGAGNDKPVFCFHPAGGELNVYHNVAQALSNRYSVLGIQSRVMAGETEEFASLSEMIAAYADLVQQHDPRGPHRLFGFSFGGLLALHTARVLLDRGAAVAWIGVAETDLRWSASHEYAEALTSFLVGLYEHMRGELRLLKAVPVDALRGELPDLVQSLISTMQGGNGGDATASVLMDWFSTHGYFCDDIPRGLVQQYLARVAAHLRLLPRNEPCPTVSVPLHVWQAADGLVSAGAAWQAVTDGPLQVRLLAGNHFDLMAPPQSHVIAAELGALTESAAALS